MTFLKTFVHSNIRFFRTVNYNLNLFENHGYYRKYEYLIVYLNKPLVIFPRFLNKQIIHLSDILTRNVTYSVVAVVCWESWSFFSYSFCLSFICFSRSFWHLSNRIRVSARHKFLRILFDIVHFLIDFCLIKSW